MLRIVTLVEEADMAETITEKKTIRLPEVLKLTGLSRTTVWRRVAAGEFPVPLRLGGPKSRRLANRGHR